MTVDLRLKDCSIVDIQSYLSTETIYDFYNDTERAISYITFVFHDPDSQEEYKKSFVEFKIDDEDYADFCSIANFFYGKGFAEMTKEDFIRAFEKELCATVVQEGVTRK